MTLAERDVCRIAMRDNLAFHTFVGQRIDLLLPECDFEHDLEASSLTWDLCRTSYVQGLKDGYQATQGKCEKLLTRSREDGALKLLHDRLKRSVNRDYVSDYELCKALECISMAYRQGLKEGQLPLGALAI